MAEALEPGASVASVARHHGLNATMVFAWRRDPRFGPGFTAGRWCCIFPANMLTKIKITVNLTTMPKAQHWPKFDERAADMMIGWHSDTEDSANFYEFLAMTPNADTGRGQYNSNAEVDSLTEASLLETDDAKRADMLRKIEKILFDEVAYVPLHWQDLSWAARKGVGIEAVINVQNFPYLGDLVIK